MRPCAQREHALLHAGEEQRPHAAGAQLQRIEHGHEPGPGQFAAVDLEPREHRRQLARRGGCRVGGGTREVAQFRERAAAARQRACLIHLPRVEDRGPPTARRREQAHQLSARLLRERCGPTRLRRRETVDRVEPEQALLPARPRLLDGSQTEPSHVELERVRELRAREPARRAQPGQQVRRCPRCGPVRPGHASQQPDQRAARAGVGQRPPHRHRDRDAGGAEDLGCEPRGAARVSHHDGDLLGIPPLAQQRRDARGDQLELGTLAAALEQLDGRAGGDASRAQLEQRPLEVRERRARMLRVVVLPRRHRTVLLRQRRERLERRGTPGESGAPRLIGERHRHRRFHEAPERLDRVELQRREVVEAVEQDGRRGSAGRAPQRGALAQRIERPHRPLLLVDPADLLQPAVVGDIGRRRGRSQAPRRCPPATPRAPPDRRAGDTRASSSSANRSPSAPDEARLGDRPFARDSAQQPLARQRAEHRRARPPRAARSPRAARRSGPRARPSRPASLPAREGSARRRCGSARRGSAQHPARGGGGPSPSPPGPCPSWRGR